MLPKCLPPIIALLIVISVASAQNYHIRNDFNTNIRSEPSLQARIVETASAGSTLLVVGQQDRWLRISQGEGEAWLANWVRHSPVPPAATPINNCCFVDRQCQSDADWTAGYWAYQNGQCSAVTETQTPTTQPLTTAPAQPDNCCFLDRRCATDQDWVHGYFAYQNNHCGTATQTQSQTPAQPAARPLVEGPAAFIRGINRGLDWIKRRSPEWYQYVISGADSIVPTHTYGASFARVAEAKLLIDGRAYGSVVPLGMALVHEACHLHRYRAGLQAGGKLGEVACIKKRSRLPPGSRSLRSV